MDNAYGAGIVALMVVIASCLTVFFLKVAEPTSAVVDFLFPRLRL